MNIAALLQLTPAGASSPPGVLPAGTATAGEIKGNLQDPAQGGLFSQLLGGQTQLQSVDLRRTFLQLQQSGGEQMGQELPAGGKFLPGMMAEIAPGMASGQMPWQGEAPPGLLTAQGNWPGRQPLAEDDKLAEDDIEALEALLQELQQSLDPATSALSPSPGLSPLATGEQGDVVAAQLAPVLAQRLQSAAPIHAQAPQNMDKQALFASLAEHGVVVAVADGVTDADSDGLDITSMRVALDKLQENPFVANGARSGAGDELPSSVSTTSTLSVSEKGQAGQLQRAAAELQLPTAMDKPEWGKELGNRILWMTRQDVQSARIQLNPPHLGPIEVRVSVHNDIANVAFSAQHAQVREALEQAIPRLRDMLDSSGFTQADVGVSDNSYSGTREQLADQGLGRDWREPLEGDGDFTEGVMVTSSSVEEVQAQGLIDYFA